MSRYAVLTLRAQPGTDGDVLADRMLRQQDAAVPVIGRLVPRTETSLYQRAVDDARRNCEAAGYGFEVIDAADALVAVTIPKGHWRHRVERLVRVVELEPRHVLGAGMS